MARFDSPLDRVRIAAPCKADWDQMIGTDRVRFCGQCNLNVYNFSSMTKEEAESFVTRNEGRLCVRFYRRADGSILTNNCPVGLKAIRRRVSLVAKAAAGFVLSFFAGLGVYEIVAEPAPDRFALTGVMALNEMPKTEDPTVDFTVVTIPEPGSYISPPIGCTLGEVRPPSGRKKVRR